MSLEANAGRSDAPRTAGMPVAKLCPPSHPEGDEELLTLRELSIALKRRGIVKKSPKTLYEWVTRGCVNSDNGEIVLLRSQRIGRIRHSCVSWFRSFLDGQETGARSE